MPRSWIMLLHSDFSLVDTGISVLETAVMSTAALLSGAV